MRDNGPISGREIEMRDGSVLVSRTDTGGRITFVNRDFIEISGFTEAELVGAPHNLVRHPHMPQAAFADLWATIKAGQPWEGLVKNRAKNGDHYWVRANVTPVVEVGTVTGFISIRTKPSRAQIDAAERLYQAIREGRAGQVAIRQGEVVRLALGARLCSLANSLRGRLGATMAIMMLFLMVMSWLGYGGLGESHPMLFLSTLILGQISAFVLGAWLLKAIKRPMQIMEQDFEAIAQGNLVYQIQPTPTEEFRHLNAVLRSMRAKLAYSALERQEIARRGEEDLKREMMALTETLEGEVQDAVGEISVQSKRLSEAAHQLSGISADLSHKAEEVAQSVQVTSSNVDTVAGATAELEASSREISAQVDNSSRLAETARNNVDEASQRVSGLTEATARIGDVVAMIRAIAGQTRMLALNATIEAARAGEAGKGFAVVASEVKSLADQTEQAIGTVNTQADEIGRSTGATVETVETVAGTIREIDAIAGEVARAAGEQRSATAEIMASAAQAAEHTRSVADNVSGMAESVTIASETAQRVNDLSGMVSRDIMTLQRRLYVILRTSYGGDRRHTKRVPAAVKFSIQLGGTTFGGFTGDLSPGGAFLVVAGGVKDQPASTGAIELDGVGRLTCRVMAHDGIGLHIALDGVGSDAAAALAARIERSMAEDEPYLAIVKGVAEQASQALEKAISTRAITSVDLFDSEYVPIPDTTPVQVLAKHTTLVEGLFPALIEPPLGRDERIVFCCITDRNGYIAAHNKKYSHPQKPGDTVWNTANSRNRRIFDDRTGILAARCVKPLVLTYSRDMGGGNFVVLKELDAPIMAGGRRWGAVRMAIRL